MRGFVLSFEVATVPRSLKPTKSTELGNLRQRPRARHDVPYFEQDVEGTIEIELEHCHEMCKVPCTNQEDTAPRPGELSPSSSPGTPFPNSPTTKLSNADETSQWGSPYFFLPRQPPDALGIMGKVDGHPPNYKPFSRAETLLNELGRHNPFSATWALNASQMLYAWQENIIPGPPKVTAEDLSERSKGDAFVKVTAVFQITWLVIQIVARSFQGLATTLLEITVLAFAATAISTYLCLLGKPQDIRLPILVDAPRILTREQIIGLATRSSPSSMAVHEFWLHGVAIRDQADNVFPCSPGVPVYVPKIMKEAVYINTTIADVGIAGTIFGSIHCAAWNFQLPTTVEQLLWRVSCLVILIMPLMGALMYATIRHEAMAEGRTDNKTNRWLKPLGYSLVPLYLLARLYLTVEIFRSLAYLPASAYGSVSLPNWLPHVV
ncbi:MAG: hypothetical protein LQ340_003495 [Diploschistes diacapsis]|nr:MAG: hypothetical protein LQ340_003495 [Diploschistes diacapsis]